MDASSLHKLIDTLPTELQKEVYNFAAFLLESVKVSLWRNLELKFSNSSWAKKVNFQKQGFL